MSDKDVDPDAKERLEKLLLDGINSGEPIEADEAYWEQRRARLLAKFKAE